MKIVLATGIYPPDLGGPATYVHALAEELTKAGEEVKVVTYGIENGKLRMENDQWEVVRVSKKGGPILRWMRYKNALKAHANDADIVYAFSSISVGIPLLWAKTAKPRLVLRLGGDFFWERYTDRGGMKPLREWYAKGPWSKGLMTRILRGFHHIVFSSQFQRELYERFYTDLPAHSVIENALPSGAASAHAVHAPARILFLGRFVGFKNIIALIQAVRLLPGVTLTIAGDGPLRAMLRGAAATVGSRVTVRGPVRGEEKAQLFAEHDLLMLPSVTEISPNTALEARAAGLPVLLTSETGLSDILASGMIRASLRTSEEIAAAIQSLLTNYTMHADASAMPPVSRPWSAVAGEHLALFRALVS